MAILDKIKLFLKLISPGFYFFNMVIRNVGMHLRLTSMGNVTVDSRASKVLEKGSDRTRRNPLAVGIERTG